MHFLQLDFVVDISSVAFTDCPASQVRTHQISSIRPSHKVIWVFSYSLLSTMPIIVGIPFGLLAHISLPRNRHGTEGQGAHLQFPLILPNCHSKMATPTYTRNARELSPHIFAKLDIIKDFNYLVNPLGEKCPTLSFFSCLLLIFSLPFLAGALPKASCTMTISLDLPGK